MDILVLVGIKENIGIVKEDNKMNKKVTIYTTPQCTWCTKLKLYLKDHKVKFEEKDVNTDIKNREEMATLSGQYGVPVIDMGNKAIVGFNLDQINDVLKDWGMLK